MELYSENKHYKLYHGDMLDLLQVVDKDSIDSIVTDPPYGLTSITKRFGKENSAPNQYGKDGSFARLTKGFMGKEWDGSGIEYNVDAWRKCYEVLKPGGYLLAFGGSRTYHRIACAIEDAGFEIRDTIMWLYGSGFPKSLNIGLAIDKKNGVDNRTGRIVHHAQKGVAVAETRGAVGGGAFGEARDVEERKATNERAGRGTALKPSYEPIIVARKPFKGSCVDNVIKYGVGGINIDECRVGDSGATKRSGQSEYPKNPDGTEDRSQHWARTGHDIVEVNAGRFPANTILTYDESDFDEVCGGFPNTKSRYEERNDKHDFKGNKEAFTYGYKKRIGSGFNDEGSASRYFYAAKASKRDRDEGLGTFAEYTSGDLSQDTVSANVPFNRSANPKRNVHPTVKPTDLMQYLVRLVTPNGGTVLDPFNGSGSTGKAVMYENKDRNKNYKYIGIELTEEYLPIARARIEYVIDKVEEKPEGPYEKPLF